MLKMPPCASRRAACLLLASLALPGFAHADPVLPQRDLIVELRSAGAGARASGWDLSSADAARDPVQHRLRVRNGQSARLAIGVTRPVQTWQLLPGVWRGVAAPATQWISAAQTLVVQPRWPGGTQPVAVTLRVHTSRFDPAVAPGSGEPPQRGELELETTVAVPLGEWVALASSGEPDPSLQGAVGSRDAAPSRRMLQLRIGVAAR